MVEVLAAQTPEVQAVVVAERLDAVARFQHDLEGELGSTFDLLKTLRDAKIVKGRAPGAKVNLEAAKLMMENTHRLHPERGGPQGERVTVNVLVQLLTAPE
jgi:hypothetical protein